MALNGLEVRRSSSSSNNHRKIAGARRWGSHERGQHRSAASELRGLFSDAEPGSAVVKAVTMLRTRWADASGCAGGFSGAGGSLAQFGRLTHHRPALSPDARLTAPRLDPAATE